VRILIADDDPAVLASLAAVLGPAHEVVPCGGGAAAVAAARERSFDLVITDICMPPPDGFEVLRATRALSPPPPVVVLTGLDTARTAVQAMHLGASDVLVKPAEPQEILKLVSRLEAEDPDDEGGGPLAGLVGGAALVRRVRRMVPLLARSGEAVLILGETGTGKELMARALHEHGPRRAGPFVVHNMAATPDELAESVFFGHVRGAFSGATADHAGLFEEAEGGTLFLDEIDSFPLHLQAKLLRVLEGGRIQRVGSSIERTVDVRIVAASAVDLGELAAAGRFRADLYYRLRQLEVTMPPLRDHMEDVPALARHFLLEGTREPGAPPRLSPATLDLLVRYRWPGNCRELRNAMRSAAVLAGAAAIQPGHLPCAILRAVQETAAAHPTSTLLAAECAHIRETLEQVGGNRSRAARLLGIDRGTLARKLRSLGLEAPDP
jgi:two-component system NtrC family response regulator